MDIASEAWLKLIRGNFTFRRTLMQVNQFLKEKNTKADLEKKENELDRYWNEEGYGDFSRYATKDYIYAGARCFEFYSKPAAISAYRALHDKNITSIVDWGAGLGLSTILLQRLFPEATVYYHNLEDTMQKKFFNKYKDNKIIALDTPDQVVKKGPFDLIFCVEVLEHLEDPLDLIMDIQNLTARYFCMTQSFKVKAYGHLREYKTLHGSIVEPHAMSQLTLQLIRQYFHEEKIKTWNSRPRLFKRRAEGTELIDDS